MFSRSSGMMARPASWRMRYARSLARLMSSSFIGSSFLKNPRSLSERAPRVGHPASSRKWPPRHSRNRAASGRGRPSERATARAPKISSPTLAIKSTFGAGARCGHGLIRPFSTGRHMKLAAEDGFAWPGICAALMIMSVFELPITTIRGCRSVFGMMSLYSPRRPKSKSRPVLARLDGSGLFL